MTMHKKLQEAMRNGVILERDRVMRLLTLHAKMAREALNKKLMPAGEKHIAEVRLKLAEAIIAAIQMHVMQGVDPDADPVQPGPGAGDRNDPDLDPGA